MKTTLVLVAAFFLCGCATTSMYDQQSVPAPIETIDAISDSRLAMKQRFCAIKETDSIFTGKAVSHYPSGKIESVCNFKDGKLHGMTTDFHETGKVKEQAEFNNGIPSGIFRQWDENGKLIRYGNWQTGEWVTWDEKGNMVDHEILNQKE
jgi:hypothetical protein